MHTPTALIVVSFCLSCAADDQDPGSSVPTAQQQVEVATAEASAPAPALDPAAVVKPPAAPPEPLAPTSCPREMVQVGKICIDRYEAQLRPITSNGVGPPHPHSLRLESGRRYLAVSQPGVLPQGYISRNEASAACREAKKRLCSRGEWLLACRGTPSAPVASGQPRACNHGKIHLLTKLFGGDYDYQRSFNSPQLNLTPGFLARTGAYPDCTSTLGVHDMVGNLHEWVSDTVTASFLHAFESEGVRRQFQYKQLGNAVFMGGFYSTKGELGAGCLFTTVAHDANYHDYSTGFRCCRGIDDEVD